MNSKGQGDTSFAAGLVVAFFFSIVFFGLMYTKACVVPAVQKTSYKQGQVDVLSGQKVCYELKEHEDKTVSWIETETECWDKD
jgi:hypothetical protein